MDVFKKKFASLKAACDVAKKSCLEAEQELQAMMDKCEEHEDQARELFKEIQDLEDEIDSYESRHNTAQGSLDEATTKKEEQTQVKQNLTNRVTRDDSRINRLQAEYDEVTEKNTAAENKFKEITDEIDETETALEEEEAKWQRLTAEGRELETKMIEVGNDLRSKTICHDQNTTRSTSAETTIESLTAKLDIASDAAKGFEDSIADMEEKQQQLDDELEQVKMKHHVKQCEIEDLKNMINDM